MLIALLTRFHIRGRSLLLQILISERRGTPIALMLQGFLKV